MDLPFVLIVRVPLKLGLNFKPNRYLMIQHACNTSGLFSFSLFIPGLCAERKIKRENLKMGPKFLGEFKIGQNKSHKWTRPEVMANLGLGRWEWRRRGSVVGFRV